METALIGVAASMCHRGAVVMPPEEASVSKVSILRWDTGSVQTRALIL
jgi:hypothetical protein